jgi:hypothetical protein
LAISLFLYYPRYPSHSFETASLDATAEAGWRKSLGSVTEMHLMALVRPADRREVAFEPSVRGLAVRLWRALHEVASLRSLSSSLLSPLSSLLSHRREVAFEPSVRGLAVRLWRALHEVASLRSLSSLLSALPPAIVRAWVW